MQRLSVDAKLILFLFSSGVSEARSESAEVRSALLVDFARFERLRQLGKKFFGLSATINTRKVELGYCNLVTRLHSGFS